MYERHYEDVGGWLNDEDTNRMAEEYYKISACVHPKEYIENLELAA